jgi:hypothetical protein
VPSATLALSYKRGKSWNGTKMSLPETNTTEPSLPPPFWTAQFHLQYFPQRLWANLKNHPDSRKVHVLIEIPIALVVCALMLAWGFPSATQQHSPTGWVLTLLGAFGLIALVAVCVSSTARVSLNYSEFEPWTFLFLVCLGFFGALLGPVIFMKLSLGVGLMLSPVGLGLGYLVGIKAGLWAQRLGPLRALGALIAGLGAVAVVISGIIEIFILANH